MLKITHHTNGPRVYLLGLRLHHGLAGTCLLAAGVASHHRTLAVAGVLMVLDDLQDFPWRLRERSELLAR